MSVESKAKINIAVNWSHVVSVESKAKINIGAMEFMSRVSRVKQFTFVCISLNNGLIFNLIEILKLSQSPLYSQCISFYYLLRVLRVRQKLTYESMEFVSWVSRVVIFTSIYNVYSNSKSLNYNISWIKASNYTKLRIKPSNYNYFELNYM